VRVVVTLCDAVGVATGRDTCFFSEQPTSSKLAASVTRVKRDSIGMAFSGSIWERNRTGTWHRSIQHESLDRIGSKENLNLPHVQHIRPSRLIPDEVGWHLKSSTL
jgi:hypothetical protein